MAYILTPFIRALRSDFESESESESESENASPTQICKRCEKNEVAITVTHEDMCTYCQFYIPKKQYCLECYLKQKKYDVCMVCRKLFEYKRILPKEIALKLKHPDDHYHKCNTCGIKSDDLVMYYPTTHFCTACLTFRDHKRYMCKYCYVTYKEKYTNCFYCLEIIYTNPEKQYINTYKYWSTYDNS